MTDERGSITPLIIGFVLVVAMLVAVVIDASAAFLVRQRLDSIADAAALAATEGLAGDVAYDGGLDDRAQIDGAAARRYAAASIAVSAGGEPGIAGIGFEVHAHNRVVEVDVHAPLHLPIPVPGVTGSAVTGHAASVVEIRR